MLGDVGPRVAVEPQPPEPTNHPGRWHAAWRVTNLSERVLEIVAAWCPHGRFRAPAWEPSPAPRLAPGASATVATIVACDEPVGTVVENAFVILRARWGEEPWRILARLEIRVDERQAPRNVVALLTTQPIGFADSGQTE